MEAIAGPQHGPLAEISPQSSRLSSPTVVAGWLNDMGQGESLDKEKAGPARASLNSKATSWRRKRGSIVLDDDEDPSSKRNSIALEEDDVSSIDSGLPTDAGDSDAGNREETETNAFDGDNHHDSASDSGTTSVESSENRIRDSTENANSTHDKLPSTPNMKSKPTRAMSIDKFRTEAAIEQRMEELRYLYRQNLIQYRKITAERGCMNDPPFHRPAERSKSFPSGASGAYDFENTRRSRRNTAFKSIGDDDFGRRAREADLLSTSVPRTPTFSTKPTPEEIIIDGNGHKTYQCLLCPRKFTHPPAFSQHKRSHGREQAEAAARAAAAAVAESSSSEASTP